MTGAVSKVRLSLRNMEPQDISQIKDWVGVTWSWGEFQPVDFDTWLADERSVVRVAVRTGGQIVGVQHYQRLDADQCWLSGLRVHPDYRGRGVATRLLRDAIEIARKDGLGVLRYATEAVNEVVHYLSEAMDLQPRGTWLSFERSLDPAACAVRRSRGTLSESTLPLAMADWIRILPNLAPGGRHFYVEGWVWRSLDDSLIGRLIEGNRAFLSRSDLGGWSLALVGQRDERSLEATLYGIDASCMQNTLDHVVRMACENSGVLTTIHVAQHGPAAGLMVDLARRGEWRHSLEHALRIWEYDLTRTVAD